MMWLAGIIAGAQSNIAGEPPVPPAEDGLYAPQLAGGVSTLAGIGSYTWLNQESATIGDSDAGVRLQIPADASDQVRGIYWTAPAPPYELRVLVMFDAVGNGARAGVGWKSAGSQMQTVHLRFNGEHQVEAINWLDVDFPQSDMHSATPALPRAWLLLGDDGTDFYVGVSYDGVNFKELFRDDKATGYLSGSYGNILFWGDANGGGAFGTTLMKLIED